MKNTIIPLPEKYQTLLPETLYQAVKALEDSDEYRKNPALLYWAREDLIREAMETMESSLPANTDGFPWNQDDEPVCLAFRNVQEAAVDIEEIKPDTPLLDSTIRPLPPVCLKLEQTHPDLYATLKDLEKAITPPVPHEEMYFARKKVLIDYEDILDEEYYALKEKNSESDRIEELLEDFHRLRLCGRSLHRGDM